MPVGDVNSAERGSGARYNDGKVKMEYIPAHVLSGLLRFDLSDNEKYIAWNLADFEQYRDTKHLYNILDVIGLKDICDVFHYGAQKYAPWNWAKGMAWSIPMACIKRHLLAIGSGEAIDPESGLPHTGHIGCNVVMLLHFLRYYPEGDDLPPQAVFQQHGLTIQDFVDAPTDGEWAEWEENDWPQHDYQPMTAERAAELREQTNAHYA